MTVESHAPLLREEIARRLDTSSLPLAGQQKIFGGRGENQICDCCDRPIGVSDVLYEVELERATGTMLLAMHRACFNIWMDESRARRCTPSSQPEA